MGKADQFEATLHYSAPLLKRVVFAFWRRTIGVGFWVALVLLGVFVGIGSRNELFGRFNDLVISAVAVLIGLAMFFVAMIFVLHYRNTLGRFRRLNNPTATIHVDRDSLTVSSDLGTSTIVWRGVAEIWRFPSFWLLMLSRAQFVTLPLAGMSDEMLRFIQEQVDSAGGKIR